MNYVLETARLALRHFNNGDTPFIVQLLNSPGWLQFIGDRNVKTEAHALTYLQTGPFKSYAKYGYGLSLVEIKDTGEPIGMCGIINREHLDTPDIGFALLPAFMGKGYAYEIAVAMLEHASRHLGINHVSAITLPVNIHSIKLLERLGFKFLETFSLAGSEEILQLYTLDK